MAKFTKMKWQKQLSRANIRHLIANEMNTQARVKEVLVMQARDRKEGGKYGIEPCFDCKAIAVKLGLPV